MAYLLRMARRARRTSGDRRLSLRKQHGQSASGSGTSGPVSEGTVSRVGGVSIPPGARYWGASDAHQPPRTRKTTGYGRVGATIGAVLSAEPALLAQPAEPV